MLAPRNGEQRSEVDRCAAQRLHATDNGHFHLNSALAT